MNSEIFLVKNSDPKKATKKILKMLEAERFFSMDDTVLIKPNYVGASHPSTGITTDTRVVSMIIRFLKDQGVKNIIVGDGGCWDDTDHTFDVVGIRQVARKEGVTLIDLNDDEGVKIKIPGASTLKEVTIAKTVLTCDAIINVPKLKIHEIATVTLSIKNLMGAILPLPRIRSRAIIMHYKLHEKLVDLASYLKPVFNIVDGTVGCEVSAAVGDPVPMNIILGGEHIVATDAIAAYIMGVNPIKVGHLQLANKKNLGTIDLESINVIGDSATKVRKRFRR